MRELYREMEQVSCTNATVLLLGESGVGKERIAHAIHYGSPRAERPIVKLNCAAIPESLIESELFGHERGAFTGAVAARKGRFELASGGTIFLDEIGELPLPAQGTLLRVLQEREFERVGGSETVRVNVRVIAATNRDLSALIAEGRFREDLYYRLNVFPLVVPPLRERKTDIVLLANHFARKFSREHGKRIKSISAPAMALLMRHDGRERPRARELHGARRHPLDRRDRAQLPPAAEPAKRKGRQGRGETRDPHGDDGGRREGIIAEELARAGETRARGAGARRHRAGHGT
jgi:Nif-specific regulatory protein